MIRQSQLEPAWLIGLLIAWSRRETRDSGLGYYRINPMLRDGIPTQARSYEPTGYGGVELDAVGRAVASLDYLHKVSVLRYVRPWMATAVDAEHKSIAEMPGMWLALLKEAIVKIEAEMPCRAMQ